MNADVVVAGATPAGVVAAVRAARDGASVVLVDPLPRAGGLMSSGIATAEYEHMSRDSYGGLALEIYRRIGRAYGFEEPLFHWEPKIAQQVFDELLDEAGVHLRLGETIIAVETVGGRIRSATTASGLVLSAITWIDASYEGDLAALAGATMTWGRESRDTYGEDLAGQTFIDDPSQVADYDSQIPDDATPVRTIDTVIPHSPYRADGTLLPGFVDAAQIVPGAADGKTANYHYRVTLSTADDRVPFEPPAGYDPELYAPHAAHLRAMASPDARDLFDIGTFASGRYTPSPTGITVSHPGTKWELNNRQDRPVSLGHLGGQFGYPDAAPLDRPRFWADHRTHAQGLLYFLTTDESVPAEVRAQLSVFGLPADEYIDNDHWPHALYVREARRLVGELVFTQHDVLEPAARADSIGLASHWIDSHYVQRAVVPGGFRGEGRIWRPVTGLYQLPYRLMLPRRDELTNLLVPVCVSASRVAFCSIRVEAQWMALGEAAGAAAALLEGDAHDVSIAELQKLLSASGRTL